MTQANIAEKPLVPNGFKVVSKEEFYKQLNNIGDKLDPMPTTKNPNHTDWETRRGPRYVWGWSWPGWRNPGGRPEKKSGRRVRRLLRNTGQWVTGQRSLMRTAPMLSDLEPTFPHPVTQKGIADMRKYRHHKYTWTNPHTAIRHAWEILGPIGAVSFHVQILDDEKYGPTAGLEFHHTEACGFNTEFAPDHIDCPLTGGRCWHDGTSLYAIESLWPQVEHHLQAGDHPEIFRILEHEADRHFAQFNPEPKE